MGFLDVFRKKRISTPEDLLERIREIDQQIDEAEHRLSNDIEDRLRMRFDRFWPFEEAHVRSQLNRIEDLFHLGSEPVAEESGDDPSRAEKTPPVDPASADAKPLTDEDMKWVRNILWHVWRRTEGHCSQCPSERDVHFVPISDETDDLLNDDDSPFQLTPEAAPKGAEGPSSSSDENDSTSTGTAEGNDSSESPAEEEIPVPPIDESVTRQIIARLGLSCLDCRSKVEAEASR